MMEKENAGFRASAIKEFNEAVRQLVSFVKKRDRRWTPETEDQRHAAARKATAAQAARQRAANAAKMAETVPEWTKIQSSDEQDDSQEEDSEQEEEEYECVACRKTFKSEKQWESHEKSKKHQKSIYALKKQMRKDNAALGLDEEIVGGGDITTLDEDDYPLGGGAAEEEADPIPEVKDLEIDDDDNEDSETSLGDDEDEGLPTESKPPPKDPQDNPVSDSDSQDSDYAPREKVGDRLTSSTNPLLTPVSAPEPSSSELLLPEKKLGKAAQKRLKKAAKDNDTASVSGSVNGSTATSGEFECSNCSAPFPSKTKLFAHLKDNPGHAKLIASADGGGRGKKGKGKKR